jgi:excisionase family DNA binding protein
MPCHECMSCRHVPRVPTLEYEGAMMDANQTHWTCGQLARAMGVNQSTVYRWCVSGRLPALRTMGSDRRRGEFRIPQAAVQRLLGIAPMSSPDK